MFADSENAKYNGHYRQDKIEDILFREDTFMSLRSRHAHDSLAPAGTNFGPPPPPPPVWSPRDVQLPPLPPTPTPGEPLRVSPQPPGTPEPSRMAFAGPKPLPPLRPMTPTK